MIKNSALILTLIVFLANCNLTSNDGPLPDSKIKYADIELYSLKGISKLDRSSFPYIEIDSIDPLRKKIVSYYSDKKWDSATYEFHDNYWTTTTAFYADTAMMTIVKEIYKDKIIELTFLGDSSNPKILYSFSIFSGDQRHTYYPKTSHKMGTIRIDEILLQDSMRELEKDSFSIITNSLTVFSINKDYLDNKIKYDTICYNIGTKSLGWWFSFEQYIDKKEEICK